MGSCVSEMASPHLKWGCQAGLKDPPTLSTASVGKPRPIEPQSRET